MGRGLPVEFDRARVGDKQLGHFFQKGLRLFGAAVSQILSQNQIVSGFLEGALCDVQEARFVTQSALLESFDDVCSDGNRRAAHLARKAVDLILGKACREQIGRQDESVRLLPHNQILESLCWFCHMTNSRLRS